MSLILSTEFCLFYTRQMTNRFFFEMTFKHVSREDVCADFFVSFFLKFQNMFKMHFKMKEAYSPMFKTPLPITWSIVGGE
jgi:hypothetical protein